MDSGPLLTLQGQHCTISLTGWMKETVQFTSRASRRLHTGGNSWWHSFGTVIQINAPQPRNVFQRKNGASRCVAGSETGVWSLNGQSNKLANLLEPLRRNSRSVIGRILKFIRQAIILSHRNSIKMRACSWRWEEGYTYKYVDTHFSEYQPKFKFIILRLVMK